MACPVNHPLFHALVFLLGVLVVLSRYVRADASTFASAQIKGVVGTPREFTVQELERYSGLDEELPVYLALQRRVYDVTSKREVSPSRLLSSRHLLHPALQPLQIPANPDALVSRNSARTGLLSRWLLRSIRGQRRHARIREILYRTFGRDAMHRRSRSRRHVHVGRLARLLRFQLPRRRPGRGCRMPTTKGEGWRFQILQV